nr:uncharacterized protein LOC110383273 [Helicoverpa armigera]
MPWNSAGHACPITCSTIITAIDRLKQADYQYLVKHRIKKKLNISETDIFSLGQQLQQDIYYNRRATSLHRKTDHLKLYHTYHRLLLNKDFIPNLKIEAKQMTAGLNDTCFKMAAENYKRNGNLKCTRKFNKRQDVVERFTKFLNKYADPKYPFDEELAGNIVHSLEGSARVRHGAVDGAAILGCLRDSLRRHKASSSSKAKRVLKLQSNNCLTIYVPGCYCKVGYVEHELQCVKPEECIHNPTFLGYLERIILY